MQSDPNFTNSLGSNIVFVNSRHSTFSPNNRLSQSRLPLFQCQNWNTNRYSLNKLHPISFSMGHRQTKIGSHLRKGLTLYAPLDPDVSTFTTESGEH
ncbi:hypothetical protein TNCV_3748421 [Trichonephila clavipes]|nr:hypothetical protein TNCV_3748421 [Trichonephila clavipes]